MLETIEWKPPVLSELPDKLDGLIAWDLETKDDGLKVRQGPGWAWKDGGFVTGISFCADNWAGYLPFGHEGGGNLPADKVIAISNKWLGNPNQAKAGANILYDMGWGKRAGINVKGRCYDVQWAQAMLDEHWGRYPLDDGSGKGYIPDGFHLDTLAKYYLGRGKEEGLLRQAALDRGLDPKSDMWKLPSKFVGPYAIADSVLTRQVFLLQVPKLKEKELWDLFDLECSLLPLYLDMRWRGIRVDVEQVNKLRERWTKEVAEHVEEIKSKTGIQVNLNASASLASALKTQNIECPKTPKTQKDSVTKDWLEAQDHWLPKLIVKAKMKNKLVGTFIDGAILGNLHDGRLHTEFHPLREDSEDDTASGTISGRLSSSHPNLQQVPKRTEEGKLMRTCFLPEEGEKFYSIDYSQQEPRLTVHFAAITTIGGQPLAGAITAVEKYRADPRMSYHKMVAEQTGLEYEKAKTLNLGLIYGMGTIKAAKAMKVTPEQAKEYIAKYHERLPFVRALGKVLDAKVKEKGEFRTLLRRLCRFSLWELADYEKAKKLKPLPLWRAQRDWAGQPIRRAGAHKELNRLIQGSAADQTKKAMQLVMEAGLGKYMLLQVHDELCFSFPNRELAEQAAKIMENAVKLEVPVIAEIKEGINWGLAK